MNDTALRPIIRAIVDRPFLIGITILIGLFTLAYAGGPSDSNSYEYVAKSTAFIGWVLSFTVGTQIFLFAPSFRRILILALWLVATGILFRPSLGNGPENAILIGCTGLGLLVTASGSVLSRRLGVSLFCVVIIGALALAAGLAIGSNAQFLLAMACVYFVQISLFAAVKFDQFRLQTQTTRIAAGVSMEAVLPFVFMGLMFALALVLGAQLIQIYDLSGHGVASADGLSHLHNWYQGFDALESMNVFAVVGFFVLPVCLMLPGLFWLAAPLDNGFRDPREGRLDAIVPTVWAKVRHFYSSQVSYAIVLITGVLVMVSLLVLPGLPIGAIFILFAGIAFCAGGSFFSLRVFILMAGWLILTAWPALVLTMIIVNAFGLVQPQMVDFSLAMFIAAAGFAVIAAEFSTTSLNVKFARTLMVTLIAKAIGPYFLLAGAGMLMTVGSGIALLWPAAIIMAMFQGIIVILTIIIAPALLTILSLRYGKF